MSMFTADHLLIESPSFSFDSYGKKTPSFSFFKLISGSLQLKRGDKSIINGMDKLRTNHRFYTDFFSGLNIESRAFSVKLKTDNFTGDYIGRFPNNVKITFEETDLIKDTDFELTKKNEYLSQIFGRDIFEEITILTEIYKTKDLKAEYYYYDIPFKIIGINHLNNEYMEIDLNNEYTNYR